MKSTFSVLSAILLSVNGYDYGNYNNKYTPSPSESNKYTPNYDMQCYDIKYNNPCTRENILAKHFYFKSCSSCCNFIQCDEFGAAFERPCAKGTSWDQFEQTCVHNNGQCKDKCLAAPKPYATPVPTLIQKYTPDNNHENHYENHYENDVCYDLKHNNPCTEDNLSKGNFYFKSCDSCCTFIQCDAVGVAFEMPCGEGTYWDQNALTCNHNNKGQCKDKCELPETTTTTSKPHTCYDINHSNPCTEDNISKGNFYFPSCSSCCNFIQCDKFGGVFDMPCGEGTYWDQNKLTCNHNYGQCKDYKCETRTNYYGNNNYEPKPKAKYTPAQTTTTTINKPYSPPNNYEPKPKPKYTATPTMDKPYSPPNNYDHKCYDIKYNNPCTKENILAKKFYFKSCNSCCSFIQCDESGDAFEMPCGEGTYWDQNALTCNHNNGQCNDYKCEQTTYKY